ncbi:hypothetical protein K2173_000982 [Erythroxylum novogranatense]|uniref:GATA-type domain-containing protein n=1 Tax=Erythroxylum novogranatense TaxID=1862640 RepID=A0AAV8TQF5_9ROSI|nr:hypothetical protein K2173_000982 [Erythroxylum novogranatense]
MISSKLIGLIFVFRTFFPCDFDDSCNLTEDDVGSIGVPSDDPCLENCLCVPLDPIEEVIGLFPTLVNEPINGLWSGTQESKSLEYTRDEREEHDRKVAGGFLGKPEAKSAEKKSGTIPCIKPGASPVKKSGVITWIKPGAGPSETPETEELKRSWSNHYLRLGFGCKKRRSKRALKQQKLQRKRNNEEVLQTQRRCSHCQTQNTPLWRMGPMGPRTLCNACGVRYNTGRLLPEYRPAASPTFNKLKHSNFHKKIIRRRQGCFVHQIF